MEGSAVGDGAGEARPVVGDPPATFAAFGEFGGAGLTGDAGGEPAEADGEEAAGGRERRPLLSWENTRGIPGKHQVTNRIDKIRSGCTGVN